MLRKIAQVALLSLTVSLSFSLVGCAVYDLPGADYSSRRYVGYAEPDYRYSQVRSAYGYTVPVVTVRRYQPYPLAPQYRYPARQPVVYGYRSAPSAYWPIPVWQGYRREELGEREYRHGYSNEYRHERHERQERYERTQQRGRGWEVYGD